MGRSSSWWPLWAILAFSSTAAAESPVLLFDKNCGRCAVGLPAAASNRHAGSARLLLLQPESDGGYRVTRHWQATYGGVEGDKGAVHDLRTPEGLYYTKYVNHAHRNDPGYGYVTIVLNYPNDNDVRESRAAGGVDPGAGVAIHGGYGRVSHGCVRVLDKHHRGGPHTRSIAELAAIVERAPRHIPVLSVRAASPLCVAEEGERISLACSHAILGLLESPSLPTAREVNERLRAGVESEARAVADRIAGSAEVAAAVRSASASSEAGDCGASHRERCAVSSLFLGDRPGLWCEGAASDGEGESVTVTLRSPTALRRIEVDNGNQQEGPSGPAFRADGRVAQLQVEVAGRTLSCRGGAESAHIVCEVGGARVDRVTLRIVRAERGGSGMGRTCLSRLRIVADG